MPKMEKSPPELVERFDVVAAEYPEATRRLTFGYPCLYVGGNMVSGLFESSWHVKLGPDERRELEAIRRWVQRAIQYGATLPPKVPKAKSTSKSK